MSGLAGVGRPELGEVAFASAGDLAGIRGFVRERAVAAGLAAQRADLLMLAVSELVSNAMQHAGGGGLVRVWAERGAVVCEVQDQRPLGLPAVVHAGTVMPAAEALRGRGLAIVERVCDAVDLAVRGTATVVQLRMTC
jgi:anti-sigma regulatory factor (Ser/Thr protein kinase)